MTVAVSGISDSWGLEEWHVPIIIGLLPVLLHVSLGIFIIGLIVFVSRLHVVISAVIGGLGFVALAFYIVTNLLPLIHPQCPYRSPLTVFIYPSYSYFRNRFYSIPNNLLSKSSFRDVEQGYVTQMSDIIDARTILWLHSATSDPNVQNLAIETTSSLPLQSTELVSRDFSNIMFHCRAEIKACLLSPTGFVFDHNSSELPENIKKGNLIVSYVHIFVLVTGTIAISGVHRLYILTTISIPESYKPLFESCMNAL